MNDRKKDAKPMLEDVRKELRKIEHAINSDTVHAAMVIVQYTDGSVVMLAEGKDGNRANMYDLKPYMVQMLPHVGLGVIPMRREQSVQGESQESIEAIGKCVVCNTPTTLKVPYKLYSEGKIPPEFWKCAEHRKLTRTPA